MTKRGSHEGSIYKRNGGRWTASIHLGYEGSRRRRKEFSGKDTPRGGAKAGRGHQGAGAGTASAGGAANGSVVPCRLAGVGEAVASTAHLDTVRRVDPSPRPAKHRPAPAREGHS